MPEFQIGKCCPSSRGLTFHGYDDAYTSEDLLAALDAGMTVKVHSGPFDSADDARYALDVRWESPE